MDELTDNDEEKNKDLCKMYKIFEEIYSKAPIILKDLSNNSVDIDYKEEISDHIDFKTIHQKIQDNEYILITDVIKDIRLVFLNCYKFYGAKSDFTKKVLTLEELLENKINHLDENFKSLASVQHTFDLLKMDGNQIFKFRYPKNCYDSVLLRSVAHFRPERLKKYHNIYSNTLTNHEDEFRTLKELVSWENEIYFNDSYRLISSIWELLEIGNFVAILFKQFNIDVVNQGEIERMFLLPKESTTMSKIMTTLLMPIKKTKYIGQDMPYKIWLKKLCKKVSEWYKVYHLKKRDKVSVLNSLGIHPDFWAVIGDKNPLLEYDFCELLYFTKVWLIKGLCDYVTNKYKTINDMITNCNERQCTIWKNDTETEEYFYFDSMPDLRIYYYNIPYDEPSLEFLEPEKIDEEIMEKYTISTSDTSSVFYSKSRIKPNEKYFKLIANSVQGLRSFVDELDNENTSVPESLIQALDDLISKLEPQEYNFTIMENRSKIKLYNDWKSYPDRFLKEEDNTLFWEEKELKSISQGLCEEIILEKRKRKAVRQDFDIYVDYKSDAYDSEKDDELLSDFTDSEDEWGAMNKPKNKTNKVVQTTSKLVEIEKRLKEESKLQKHSKKHSLNCNVKDNIFEVENENESLCNEQKEKKVTEIVSVISENKRNKTKQNYVCVTNTFYNDSNKKSVSLLNEITVKEETEVFSDEEVLSDKSDEKDDVILLGCVKKENGISMTNENKTLIMRKEPKFDDENNKFQDLQSDSKKNKIDVLKNQDIVTIDDYDNLKKVNSNTIISNNFVKEINGLNEQGNNTKSKSNETNLKKLDIISIEDDVDDEQIVISDDEDDIQFVSITQKPQRLPVKITNTQSLNINWNKSNNLLVKNRQKATNNNNNNNRPIACSSVPKLPSNISIMPANIHVPKGIEVTLTKRPQTTISSHFKTAKRQTPISNGQKTINGLVVNVECKVISEPNWNGEVKFYVKLPNGALHPVSDELMNQYLKDNNNRLPDYWIVPLPIEVAKQYGFT